MEIEWYLPFGILSIPGGCPCQFLFFHLFFPDRPCWLVAVRLGLWCRFGLFGSIGRGFIRRIIFDAIRVSSFLDCMETERHLPFRIPSIPSGCLCRFLLLFFLFPGWWCWLVVVRLGLCCKSPENEPRDIVVVLLFLFGRGIGRGPHHLVLYSTQE